MTRRRILALAGYPLLALTLVVITVLVWEDVVAVFRNPQLLRDWVAAQPVGAPLAFVGLQVLQVVIFIIPGEVPQLAAGYLFGTLRGASLVLLGAAIGGAIAFVSSRVLGVPFLREIIPRQRLDQLQELVASPKGASVLFLLFLIPGIPKDVLCYVAGLSPQRLSVFLALSTAGRIPGVVASVLIGSSAAGQRWTLVVVVAVVATLAFLLGVLFRRRIVTLLERYSRPGRTD